MCEIETDKKFITLVDEEGKEHLFEVLDAVQAEEEQRYSALIEKEKNSMNMFRVETDQEGEYLEPIKDEGEISLLSRVFSERLDDTCPLHQK